MFGASFGGRMQLWITRFGQALRPSVLALFALVVAAVPARAQQPAVASEVVFGALSHLGVPYRFGGNDPQRGFDCSGLVRHVFMQAAALDLPRRSEDMARLGVPLEVADLAPGDLVFFNTRGRRYSHVGIYVGDGRFVHAPARRGQVRVEPLASRWWQARFNGARRLLLAAVTDGPTPLLQDALAPASVLPESAAIAP
jgi:cell wall-associated NlpC family hydrolase